MSVPGSQNEEGKYKMKMLKRTVICLLLAIVSQVIFSGCHTANGFGQDMQDAGQKIQDKTSQ